MKGIALLISVSVVFRSAKECNGVGKSFVRAVIVKIRNTRDATSAIFGLATEVGEEKKRNVDFSHQTFELSGNLKNFAFAG